LRTLKAKREAMLALKRHARDAYSKTGIKYTPASGLWPLYVAIPPDMWFTANIPMAKKLRYI
jgi:hypothetical protein